MPKKAKVLGAMQVAKLPAGCHAVGLVTGLYLQVANDQSKAWVLRAVIGNRRRSMGLGSYPTVSLARARELAANAREVIDSGGDPIGERAAAKLKRAKIPTFRECAMELIEMKRAGWKNPKQAAQWISSLESYAFPVIGHLPVDQVNIDHVRKMLSEIWYTINETADRVRNRTENVIDYATALGCRTGDNPARWKGLLEYILPAKSAVTRGKSRNFPALPYLDMQRFMADLRSREGAAQAVEFLILTATRSNETRNAVWSEIDLEAKIWTIPKERMKMEKAHKIPLSDRAIELLKSLPRFAGCDLVFPSTQMGSRKDGIRKFRPWSDATFTALIERMDNDARGNDQSGLGYRDPVQNDALSVPHGFRSTFKSWAMDCTEFEDWLSEKSLAHVIPDKSKKAYARGDAVEPRRKLMEDWAAFIEPMDAPNNVINIKRAA